MSIEIKITIPDDEIHKPDAVQKRMTLLGYVFGRADVPVIGEQTSYDPLADIPREDDLSQQARIDASHAKVEPVKKTRAKKAEPAPNISAQPEARVDPEVEAQDEADEAAEVAASAPADVVVTAEMLRAEMGAYAQKFGMDAALADGSKVFIDALGQAPEGGWKLSVVANIGGETLAKAVAAWRAAASGSARYGEGK